MAAVDMEDTTIPVIDISNVDTQTGADLVDAIAKWGFVFIKGKELGFSPRVIDATFELVRSSASCFQRHLGYIKTKLF